MTKQRENDVHVSTGSYMYLVDWLLNLSFTSRSLFWIRCYGYFVVAFISDGTEQRQWAAPGPLPLSPPISHITHTGLCRHLELAKFVGRHTANTLLPQFWKHTQPSGSKWGVQQKQRSKKNSRLSSPSQPMGKNPTAYSIFFFFGLPGKTQNCSSTCHTLHDNNKKGKNKETEYI